MQHEVVVNASLDEVVAWHSRPGAIQRLLPPWLPLEAIQEAESLESGVARLRLLKLIPWSATHQPDLYKQNRLFVDRLTTPVLSTLFDWDHYHQFDPIGASATRVTDRVQARVPDMVLAQNLYYRARQVVGDFAAHTMARRLGGNALTIAVTGSTGLIGTALCALLSTGGHTVIRLHRTPTQDKNSRHWNPQDPDPALLDGVDVVIHLAGSPIAGRFTNAHKRQLRDSRIEPTRRLAQLVGERPFIVASAVGIYGPDRGDEILTESSARGDGFLADLVVEWERAADPARESGSRVVHVRTGLVLSPRGGLLAALRPLFMAGLGGRIGRGDQWMSWIGIDDIIDVYLRCAVDDRIQGPLNAVAPSPVTNAQFTATLSRVVGMPAVLPVPSQATALIFGHEGAQEFVLAGQHVLPVMLTDVGHVFRYGDLESTLRHLLGRMPEDTLPPVDGQR